MNGQHLFLLTAVALVGYCTWVDMGTQGAMEFASKAEAEEAIRHGRLALDFCWPAAEQEVIQMMLVL